MPEVCRARGASDGQRRARPAGRAREVAVDAVGEHDVRDHAVAPLRREQGVEFDDRAFHRQRSEPDGHERGVPAPHVRIQQRRRGGHRTEVVAAQKVGGSGRQLRRSKAGIVGHRLHDATTRPVLQIGRVSGVPTAMITGAAGGLGSALADALAPTHTLLLAGRPSARLDAVAERFGATTWPIDLADPDSMAAVVEPIVELDVLIHNAGVAYPGRVAESSVDEWRSTMAVNVIGAVALTLELLPALRAAGGHVVFINSGAGINASPGLASYSSSKFALRGFADSLRNDEPSLRVTSVHPGRIATRCRRISSPTRAGTTTLSSS